MTKRCKKLEVARQMPPLRHSNPEVPFFIEDSDVVKWLVKQPKIMQYVFDKVRSEIEYDPKSGTWAGVDR